MHSCSHLISVSITDVDVVFECVLVTLRCPISREAESTFTHRRPRQPYWRSKYSETHPGPPVPPHKTKSNPSPTALDDPGITKLSSEYRIDVDAIKPSMSEGSARDRRRPGPRGAVPNEDNDDKEIEETL
ncbi:hypothetical protein BHE74_00028176 [Ensete ventricosum]|nr:hypothetical protein BHE74_00028176 [Ensete ventricosum]RZR97445.1 hypothetical protein BHM03_00026631 [Ensete ventricosum]